MKILIVAGEESGDLHGSNLVNALKALSPDLEFYGMGGKKMRQSGVKTFFDIDRMGTVGLFEIFGNGFHYYQVYRRLVKEIESQQYDAAILIDYPTLNLILAGHCKRTRCPVYYFISPQIWAWRKRRIKIIRRRVRKMFVILPFEESYYRQAGVEAEFVGHPFVELVKPRRSREQALAYFGLEPGRPTVGILPGSRINEVNSMLSDLLEASQKIKSGIQDVQFILPVADSLDPDYIQKKLVGYSVNVKTVVGENYDVMNCCDCLLTASGSVTLEAGILGCPMVIVYKLNPMTLWFARKLITVDHFGLINIVAGDRIVPELLQEEANPENIAREALQYLKNPAYAKQIRDRLLAVRSQLGEPGVAQRTAQRICNDLKLFSVHENLVS